MPTNKDITVKVMVNISDALASALELQHALESILQVLSDSLEMQRGTITLSCLWRRSLR